MTTNPQAEQPPSQGQGECCIPQCANNKSGAKNGDACHHDQPQAIQKFWPWIKSGLSNLNLYIALGTWALAFVGFRALIDSQGEITQMKTSMTMEQRPWVTTEVFLDGPLVLNPEHWKNIESPYLDLHFQLTNIGKSPALTTYVHTLMFPYTGRSDSAELKRRCNQARSEDDARRLDSTINPAGFIVYPEKALNLYEATVMDKSDYFSWTTFIGPRRGNTMFVAIVVCTDYRFVFSPELHHTDLFYYVARVGEHGDTPGAVISLTNALYNPADKSIPPPPYTIGINYLHADVAPTDLYLLQQPWEDTDIN